jgi:hypothetical protein
VLTRNGALIGSRWAMKPSLSGWAEKTALSPREHLRCSPSARRAAEKATLSKAWVLENLMRPVRITMGDEKIALTVKPRGKDGEDAAPVTVEVSARDANAANKALELLARHLGLFEIDNSQQAVAAIGREITDLEAARRIAFLLDHVAGRQAQTNQPVVGEPGEAPDDARNLH